MKAVLPRLKPDLVLVGVNQLDDMAQEYAISTSGGEVRQSLLKRMGIGRAVYCRPSSGTT